MTLSTSPFAMVVDDDPIILMHSCAILEDAGFRCHEADDADQAIILLEQHHESVALLFSDVDMPGSLMDGFGLARHVDQHWEHIEIVIASGRVSPDAGDLPAKATFISKPFSAQTVKDHLARTLPDHAKPEPLKKAV